MDRLLYPRTFAVRLAAFGVLWWVLALGDLREPALAAVSVLAATMTSMVLWAPGTWKWHPAGLLRFVPWFLWMSMAGGWDMARRAFDPRLPLDPGFVEIELELRSEPARVFLVWVLSLIPGTVASRLEDRRLTVHVIDLRDWDPDTIRRLEHLVADLFRSEA
jgi:multicomponent Na+:H+ antiporter subunit E